MTMTLNKDNQHNNTNTFKIKKNIYNKLQKYVK